MGRPLGIAAIVVLVGFAVAALLSGEVAYLVPVVILALIVGGYALLNRGMHEKVLRDAGGQEEAMADADEAIPSAHLIPDDETPAGDTSEAHDEINPHDLPMDHPGRMAAERESGALKGTTQGSVDAP